MKEMAIHPTRENRRETVRVTAEEMRANYSTVTWTGLQEGFGKVPEGRWLDSAIMTAETRWTLGLFAHAIGVDIPQTPQTKLPQVFTAYYLALLASARRHEVGQLSWNGPHEEVREAPWILGAAAAGGAERVCDQLAEYYWKIWSNGGANAVAWEDEPLFGFLALLLEAHVTGKWPTEVDHVGLRGYAGVLTEAGNPEQFRRALIDCCDHRMANAWRYESIDASKRYSASTIKSLFQDRSIGAVLMPLELLYMRYVYEKVTGAKISLEAEHPLLGREHTSVPSLWPLQEDEFCHELTSFFDKRLGSGWRAIV